MHFVTNAQKYVKYHKVINNVDLPKEIGEFWIH